MADLEIEVADSLAYAKFLSDNPPGDPYSLLPLLEAYRSAFSCDYQLLFVTRSGIPVASIALFVGKRFLHKTTKLMPIRIYDGVHFRALGESRAQKQEYDRLLALQALEGYLEKNFSFHQIVFQPGFSDIRSFQWAGAEVVPQFTYIIDLADFSENNYSKSLKEVLRSAEHSGLSASTCSIDELVTLQRISYERHSRRPPVSSDTLNTLLSALHSAGLLDIRCVRNRSGDLVAAMSWLKTGSSSFFYAAGTDAEAEKGASHLLYHEILMSEKKKGNSFVDFCGANTPTINLFKSAFGPRLQVYFKIWRANKRATRLVALFRRV
jgi:hypothetical protein